MYLLRSVYCCGVFLLVCSGRAAEFPHPLDALSADEYTAILETVKASGNLDSASRFAGVDLHEPPKQEVLRWKQGDPFRREALAVIKQGRKTFEAVVDVANRKLISWKEIPGVEPMLIGRRIRWSGGTGKGESRGAGRSAQARHYEVRYG